MDDEQDMTDDMIAQAVIQYNDHSDNENKSDICKIYHTWTIPTVPDPHLTEISN